MWDFYHTQMFRALGLPDDHIVRFAAGVRDALQAFSPTLVEEIEAVAKGAGLEAWKIYALNARSELMNYPLAECTTIWLPEAGLLGQTWDWIEPLEDWSILVTRHHENGHKLLTFGEPGMVGKIGMNSSGLGMCLNFLFAPIDEIGVPLHCAARYPLDFTSFETAKTTLQGAGVGKAGHLLLASSSGDFMSVEYTGTSRVELGAQRGGFVHTNHFLAQPGPGDAELVPGSAQRFDRAHQLLDGADSLNIATLKHIFLDKSEGDHSINCNYHEDPSLGGVRVGTIATVIMDLRDSCMHIKRGNGLEDTFSTITL